MNMAAVLLASSLCALQEDASKQAFDLIERLRSDKVEDREDAARKLADLGKVILPQLERVRKDGDVEVGGRAKDIMEEIARRERVHEFRPATNRLTLALEGVPFSQAVEKVFGPFGLTFVEWDRESASSKCNVSIRLEGATLWQAHDAFIRATGIPLQFMRGGGKNDVAASNPRVDLGEARCFGLPVKPDDTVLPSEPYHLVEVRVWLPPGAMPSSGFLQDAELVDDRGRRIETEPKGIDWFRPRRQAGRPTVESLYLRVQNHHLQGVKSVSLSARLVLVYPHDLKRYEFGLKEFKDRSTREIPGARITFEKLRTDTFGYWEMNCGWRSIDPECPQSYFVWTEDAEGHRLFEDGFGIMRARANSQSGCQLWGRIPEDRKPAKIVFNRILAEEEVSLPFLLKDLPVQLKKEK